MTPIIEAGLIQKHESLLKCNACGKAAKIRVAIGRRIEGARSFNQNASVSSLCIECAANLAVVVNAAVAISGER